MISKQRRYYQRTGLGLLIAVVVLAIGWYLHQANFALLEPKGVIAAREHQLLIIGTLLSLVIVVPVFTLTFMIVWKYRASNPKHNAAYTPDWDHDRRLEALWWGVPLLLITILGVITWQSSHELDPYRPLSTQVASVDSTTNTTTVTSNAKPITVQVIALQWKWLFIYPDLGIASVNYLEFPAATPVNFRITADAPMNSFWIPQLGGQIYAMSGMTTQLHLMANEPGEFRGVSANLSGEGFAGMKFKVRAVPNDEFNSWVQNVAGSSSVFDTAAYNELARPSKNNLPSFYRLAVEPSSLRSNLRSAGEQSTSIYDSVVMKYMSPKSPNNQMEHNNAH